MVNDYFLFAGRRSNWYTIYKYQVVGDTMPKDVSLLFNITGPFMLVLDALIIIGFYQTIILAGIVLTRKNRSSYDHYLAVLFLVFGATLLLGYLEIYNRANHYPFPFLINLSTPLILLHGPALWLYIKSLTSRHFTFRPLYLLHLLPFVLVLALFIMGPYRLPAEEKTMLEKTEAFKDEFTFPFVIGLIAVFTQGYLVWGLLLLKKYKSNIKNYYSEIDSIDLTWLKTLLITSVVFYAGISLLYIVDYIFRLFSYHLLQSIGFAYASLFILVLGYRGYRQGSVFSSHPVKYEMERTETRLPEKSDETLNAKDRTFLDELTAYMEQEKPFLNSELNLALLAEKLRVTPDYLSAILNGKLNKNFFDFINQYRINEFKRICREEQNSNITIMGMAWDAGFSSKATFNRVFKKYTGITPGEFVKQTPK